MKRLSVRLSVVGAILALGGAAIAHSVLSKGDEEAPGEPPPNRKVAAASSDDQLEPIRPGDSGDQESSTPQPPPSDMFSQSDDLRRVSHEEDSSGDDGNAALAEPIPTSDPTDPGASGSSEFRPPAPAYGGGFSSGIGVPPADPMATSPPDPTVPEFGARVSPAADAEATTGPTAGGQLTDGSTVPDQTMTPPSDQFPVGASPRTSDEPARDGNGSPPESGYPGNSYPSTGVPESDTPGGGFPAAAAGDRPTSTGTNDSIGGTEPGGGSFNPGRSGPNPPSAGIPLAAGAVGAGIGGMLSKPSFDAPGGTPPNPDPYPVTGSSPDGAAAGATSPASAASGTEYSSTSGASLGTDPRTRGGIPDNTSWPGATSDRPATPTSDGRVGSGMGTPDVGRGLSSPPTNMAAGAAGASAILASNLPGDRQLEGQQAPAVVMEKTAPVEIQVDRKTTFQIRVRNAGNAPAHNVVVVDRVPRGTEFLDSAPPCTRTPDGTLVWNLQTIKPGDEVQLSINLLPKVAGEIGSVAQATFQAQASVRTVCTKPELQLDLTMEEKVLIGRTATMEITVTNIGNGAATNVVLEEDVPEGFAHAAGRELEQEIGTLRPQESRRLTLVLDSVKPGIYKNRLVVSGDANLSDEDIREIQVTTPELNVEMKGPTIRYLDRQATYAIRLANPGTASARDVEMVAYLPKGMKYVTSDNHGQYDNQTHAVYWSLEELPADKQGDVHVTVLPIEPGLQKLKADCRANLGLKKTCEYEVKVEGLAQLVFTVTDIADPIEVGSETTYEIKVQNRGSKADTEIQLIAELPVGIVPTKGDGPSQGTVQGQHVIFGRLARLAPNEEAVYKIHARGNTMGDHVVRAQLKSTELRVPVTKEESTRVYTDK